MHFLKNYMGNLQKKSAPKIPQRYTNKLYF